MNLRESVLPGGWYPRNPAEIARFLSKIAVFSEKIDKIAGQAARQLAKVAISPHAGWYYSGSIAARAVSSLSPNAQTVIVAGGHLPSGAPPLFALEDAAYTPLGNIAIDAELRDAIAAELNGREDRYADNTVEVLLPMVRYFFPDAALVWLRLPAEIDSFEAGKKIARICKKFKRDVRFLASADLTHYGANYGFSPAGSGVQALKWVKEKNDAHFLQAVQAGNQAAALECAERDRSCCSAGSVLGAMGFAQEQSLGNARLLEYGTSADIGDEEDCPPDSFVGYAALAF